METLVLRQQLAVYERVPRRPPLRPEDRRFWSTLARNWAGWREALVVVQPDTVVRWHPHGLAAVLDLEEPAPGAGGWDICAPQRSW